MSSQEIFEALGMEPEQEDLDKSGKDIKRVDKAFQKGKLELVNVDKVFIKANVNGEVWDIKKPTWDTLRKTDGADGVISKATLAMAQLTGKTPSQIANLAYVDAKILNSLSNLFFMDD